MLVIVLSVGRVPVAVVDVVDVVAVRDRGVPAVVAVLVRVLVVGVAGDLRAGRGSRPPGWGTARPGAGAVRSHTPTGQVAANIASASSTIEGPGATVARADSQALTTRPPTAAIAPMTIAASRVVRKDRASCCEVATGTTMRAETSSSPTVRIATVTLTAASTATSRL